MSDITEQELDLMFDRIAELIAIAAWERRDPEFHKCLTATTRVIEELNCAFAAGASYVTFAEEDIATAMHMLSAFRTWINSVTPPEPDTHERKRERAHALAFFRDVLTGMHSGAHWCPSGTA
jgi:hypothetical protein